MSYSIKGIPIPSLNLIISNSFISQKQFCHTLNFNPSTFIDDDIPIHNLSYYDIILYCNTLSATRKFSPYYKLQKISTHENRITRASISTNSLSNGYRLLTKTEWFSIASNFNSTSKWSGTDDPNDLHLFAHLNSQSPIKCYDIKPNSLGFYHLTGNFKDTLFKNYLVGGSYLDSPDKASFNIINYPTNNSPSPYSSFRIARPL
jgi:hypothetical protein